MKKLLIALYVVSAIWSHSAVRSQSIVVSPGARFGYTFGAGGGVTIGAELSVLSLTDGKDGAKIGVVLNADYIRNQLRFHIGGEVPALELGPSLYYSSKGTHWAIDGSLMLGFADGHHGGYLSYTYSGIFGATDLHLLLLTYKYYEPDISFPYLGT